jgi:hypothetical protein
MKRIFFAFIAFLTIITISISCEKNNNSVTDDPIIDDPVTAPIPPKCGVIQINEEEYLQMCVVPDFVTANSVNKLVIENQTKSDFVYGTPFSIDYFSENHWIPIDLGDINWPFIGYISEAGTTSEKDINLFWVIENNGSKKGKYRIAKEFGSYKISAEFVVK